MQHQLCCNLLDSAGWVLHVARLLTAFLGNVSQKSFPRNAFLGKPCPAGRPAGRPASGRSSWTVVGGARVVSGNEKKAFDRGGPVWPPQSNAADNRLWGWSGEALPTQPKTGGSAVQPPSAKHFEQNYDNNSKSIVFSPLIFRVFLVEKDVVIS